MSEPFPGSIVDTPEKRAWVLANKGPAHVRVCGRCGLEYYSQQLKATVCWGCWYELEIDAAEARFQPLAEMLEQRLEVKTSIAQTGGMTMCLYVPIGRETNKHGDHLKYAYFGALGETGVPAFGLFWSDEEGEYLDGWDGCDDQSSLTYPGEFTCGSNPCEWYHHPDLCQKVADWAAPLIVEHATRIEP